MLSSEEEISALLSPFSLEDAPCHGLSGVRSIGSSLPGGVWYASPSGTHDIPLWASTRLQPSHSMVTTTVKRP